MENQIINVNQSVKVLLSKDAIELLEKKYQELSELIKEECKPNIDDEGYYHTQLWLLMKDFGHMFQGCYSPIINCEIVIE